MRRRLAPSVAAGCVALVLAACGVPTTAGPRALSHTIVPGNASQTTPTTAPPDALLFSVFLLDSTNNDAPIAVGRASTTQADHLSTVLNLLLSGPNSDDLSNGYTTAVPGSTKLLSVLPDVVASSNTVLSTPVTVNLSEDFTLASGSDALLEVEQVVFTISCALTPQTGSARVLFQVEGVPLPVELSNGSASTGAVTALLYNNNQPPNCEVPH